MNNLVDFRYINQKDKELVEIFLSSKNIKRYILGINKFTKSVLKYIEVDGVIDDFTRVQKSRKKEIFQIENVPKDALILWTSTGNPLDVKIRLDELEFDNFSYLALQKYSSLNLVNPPFISDFKNDFLNNRESYQQTYDLLEDKSSKEIFQKVINFKISYDYNFMRGFVNNFDGQYFDLEFIPKLDNIVFLDGGGYVGDTIPNIIKNYPNFKKIYMIEPSGLHIKIAKRDFNHIDNIEFINCGLGSKKIKKLEEESNQNNCNHNFQAVNIDTIDNICNGDRVDFIKLDIEGAEQDAIDGATETIKKYRPILAICIYHKAEDWYKIPQKVLAIDSGYKLYLRHYMQGIFETVLYFIPEKV